MGKFVGLWIDFTRAHIVTLVEGTATVQEIASDYEGKRKATGGSRKSLPYAHDSVEPSNRNADRRQQELARYYAEIAETIRDAQRLYIFGPGEARTGLERVLREEYRLGDRIERTESADRMTDNQVAARVREYYEQSAARRPF